MEQAQASKPRKGKHIDVIHHEMYDRLEPGTDMVSLEAYLRRLSERSMKNRAAFQEFGLRGVRMTRHALERWNTRVGPQAGASELEARLTILGCELGRIHLLSKNVGIIDDDIVFIYEIEGTQLVCITFYGRKSLRPALFDMRHLLRFNGREDDEADIQLEPEELAGQLFPPLPYKLLMYRGTRSRYQLEVYDNTETPIFRLVESVQEDARASVFRQDKGAFKPSKSTITALSYLGYKSPGHRGRSRELERDAQHDNNQSNDERNFEPTAGL
ncbi:hypothetical protein J2T17_006327 [Paenibacillus mucilaginosus]|uniref:hypothetical protein n=1 Tax=Paenibacillus mucilaginosus TaxID=61624 RepID=UPI003D25F8DD